MKKTVLIFITSFLILLTGCKPGEMKPEDAVSYYNALQGGIQYVVDYEQTLYGDLIFKTIKLDGKEYYHPLEVAFKYHQYELAEWLLENGSNPNDIAVSTNNPLLISLICFDDVEGVQTLLKYSVKTDILDTEGLGTPLHFAAALSNTRMMGILRRYFDINITNPNGETPLMMACCMSQYENVIYLVERGADINLPGNLGSTPLIYAIAAEQVDIAEYLIRKGADIGIMNNEGHDALWYAEEHGLEITGLNK